MQDVNNVLRDYNEVIGDWHKRSGHAKQLRPMTIYPMAIMYDSATQRDQEWGLYLKRNEELYKEHTVAEWEQEKAAFGIIGDAVSQSNQRCYTIYLASKQNHVYAHGWEMRVNGGQDSQELRDKFRKMDREWHEFVLILNQQKACLQAYIYDPSYHPPDPNAAGTRKLKSIPLVGGMAYKVIKALKGRGLKVKEYWVGGGGNESGRCRAMSLQWIKDNVEEMTKGTWKPPTNWEKVNLA
ncbi:hypothetical protein N431DRAFT_529048 [Stipitochalara longipes BDJ]|nr:hypothetical protein N431DRAFT_529048 [Stipitochalara longipes BDJ]